jgi:hypothetical protein
MVKYSLNAFKMWRLEGVDASERMDSMLPYDTQKVNLERRRPLLYFIRSRVFLLNRLALHFLHFILQLAFESYTFDSARFDDVTVYTDHMIYYTLHQSNDLQRTRRQICAFHIAQVPLVIELP